VNGAPVPRASAARRAAAFLPAAAWAALVFATSHSSSPPGASLLKGLDFPVHVAVYGVLGFLAAMGFAASLGPGRLVRAAACGAVAATLYGVADEIHQSFVPDRRVEGTDLAADALGGVLGAAVWALQRRGRR
jgi:VanZ family protein